MLAHEKKKARWKKSLRRASFTVYDAPAQMGYGDCKSLATTPADPVSFAACRRAASAAEPKISLV